jgi:phosphatidylglycerophosphate synthase
MIVAYLLQRPLALAGLVLLLLGGLFLILTPRESAFLAWTGVCLLAGLALVSLARRHASAEAVHRYYQALAMQEYEVAFQYLSPVMGMPLTRFVAQAQATDTALGVVTSYLITRVAIVSSCRTGHASFTVKVKRHGQWYRLHPYVVKEGRQWRIRRFDAAQAMISNDR